MYIVATIRPWHIELYRRELPFWDGDWRLVTSPDELNALLVQSEPRYVFFPHWSWKVLEEIWRDIECVCFHETLVPFGRGGSPIQNMIEHGYDETVISALRMVEELDAGPVYCQSPLSLHGSGEEIFIRSAEIIRDMILYIVKNEPKPSQQIADVPPFKFKRREPWQSEIPGVGYRGLIALFDHIRMLDAAEYPRAFMEYGGWRFEFIRPALRVGRIEADVRITEC